METSWLIRSVYITDLTLYLLWHFVFSYATALSTQFLIWNPTCELIFTGWQNHRPQNDRNFCVISSVTLRYCGVFYLLAWKRCSSNFDPIISSQLVTSLYGNFYCRIPFFIPLNVIDHALPHAGSPYLSWLFFLTYFLPKFALNLFSLHLLYLISFLHLFYCRLRQDLRYMSPFILMLHLQSSIPDAKSHPPPTKGSSRSTNFRVSLSRGNRRF